MGRVSISLVVCLLALALVPRAARAEDEPAAHAAALLKRGDDTFRTREYAAATALYDRAVEAAEKAGATETLVEALSMAARGRLIRDLGKEGQPLLDRAAKLADPKHPRGWSRYLGVKGRFEWKFAEDKPKATKTFEAMYAYCIQHELWNRAVDAAHMVAITGTPEQQVAWGLKGIRAAEQGGMDGWLGPLWNNLGNTYGELGEHDKALDAFRKARDHHWRGTSEHRKLVADWAVGMAYRKAGDLAKAKQWLRPVLAWAERRHAEKQDPERGEWVGLACAQLGYIALAEERFEPARQLLRRARPYLEAVDMASWDPAGWKELEAAVRAATRKSPRGALLEARMHLRGFEGSIDMYRMRHKKLPASLEELTATDGLNPHPFLKRIPKDPWGNAYAYRTLGRSTYEVRSHGPDGTPDTDDDLVWPERD